MFFLVDRRLLLWTCRSFHFQTPSMTSRPVRWQRGSSRWPLSVSPPDRCGSSFFSPMGSSLGCSLDLGSAPLVRSRPGLLLQNFQHSKSSCLDHRNVLLKELERCSPQARCCCGSWARQPPHGYCWSCYAYRPSSKLGSGTALDARCLRSSCDSVSSPNRCVSSAPISTANVHDNDLWVKSTNKGHG